MDTLFNNLLAHTSDELSFFSALIAMVTSILLGGIIAFTYHKTQEEESFQRSMAITLVMLPMILSVIILFVGSNIARAFSLAGTLSIIRFRSAPGDPKDIGFIFFDIAAGLACGVGLYGYGAIFVLLLCVIIVIIEKCQLFAPKSLQKTLKITIPEDLNYQGAFDDILKTYTKKYTLTKIKTTDLGSLFELCYRVTMDGAQNEQEFLNELRCRNGNLNITLAVAPHSER
ncbi:MAG: DUF4956 domain-containing protein [Clostridia bacterium]|nr:DUF4956 domain-containing protein [Clostridia bacterium]